MYDAVIFDLDGTLIDTEALAIPAGVEALAELGHAVSEDFLHTLVGIDDATGVQRLSAHLGIPLERETVNAAWDTAMARRMSGGIPLKPGAADILDLVDGLGLPKAIATSSRHPQAYIKLDHAGLTARFTHVVTFDCVTAPKPAPDPYLRAADLLGAAPARCLAFEDSDTGARSAQAAGMKVIQVPDLLPASGGHAHYIARDLADGAAWAGLTPPQRGSK